MANVNGGAEPPGKNSRRHADLAHAQPERRHLARPRKLQHPQVVLRVVGHGADLDDVGVQRGQPAVDVFQVVGRPLEVVHADDPLGGAEAGDLAGDVFLQVDVLGPLGDRRPQEDLPLLFAARVAAAVAVAATGDDHGRGPARPKAA